MALEVKEIKSTTRGKNRPDPYNLRGDLPDWAVHQFIKDGYIRVDPLPEAWEERFKDPMSIDFHLGSRLRWFKKDDYNTIDTRNTTPGQLLEMMHEVYLQPDQPFVLTDEKMVIAATKERLTLPDDIWGRLHGKSSLARIFTFANITADRFDPGWDGNPVLEIATLMPGKNIILYEGMKICAFSFARLAWGVENPYMSKPDRNFGGTDQPEVSRISTASMSLHSGRNNGNL